jgi:tetratricopeptide (TPR) repeat protein
MKKRIVVIMGVVLSLCVVAPVRGLTGRQNAAMYLERGVRYYRTYNLNLAAGEFEKGLDAAKFARDRRTEERLAASLGSVFMDQEDYRTAVYYLGEALSDAEVLRDKQRVTADLIALGNVHQMLGNQPKALSYYEDALRIVRQQRDRTARTAILVPMSVSYAKLGFRQKARACLAQVLAQATADGRQSTIGNALAAFGNMYRIFGEQNRAAAYYESALRTGRQAHDADLTGSSLSSLGTLEFERGNCDRALAYLKEAVALGRTSRSQKKIIDGLNALGRTYFRYGDFANARSSCDEALEIARGLGNAYDISVCLGNLGDIYRADGDNQKALSYYTQALTARQEAGGSAETQSLRLRIAECHAAMGELETAEAEYSTIPDLLQMGRVNLARKSYQRAIDQFCKTFEGRPETWDDEAVFASYTGIGQALAALEDYPSAVTNFAKAIALLEEREQTALTAEGLAFPVDRIRGFYADDAYEGLLHVLALQGKAEESFYYADALKLRRFSRVVMSRQFRKTARGIAPGMAQEEDANRIQIEALKKELASARRFGMGYNLEAKERELQGVTDKQRRLVDRLWKLYPAYACLRYPRPFKTKNLDLHGDETLLEFAATDQAVYLYLVNGRNKRLKLRRLPGSRGALRAQVAEYLATLRTEKDAGQAAAAGARLFDAVFGSALNDIPAGTTLVIVPDETLGSLPFEALSVDGRYMADRWHLSYAQSATWLSVLRERERYGEPDSEVLALYGAAAPVDRAVAEIDAAVTAWGDRRHAAGTTQNTAAMNGIFATLQSLFGEKAMVLSAGAAHDVTGIPFGRYRSILWGGSAFLDNSVPYVRQPFIALPAGYSSGSSGGKLALNTVIGLDIPAASVVLPCSDADGDGALAMTRAFQTAGSDTVILSRWRTADEAVVIFCSALYRRLAAGDTPAEAAEAARGAVRAKGYEHPFFWAGFMTAGK